MAQFGSVTIKRLVFPLCWVEKSDVCCDVNNEVQQKLFLYEIEIIIEAYVQTFKERRGAE